MGAEPDQSPQCPVDATPQYPGGESGSRPGSGRRHLSYRGAVRHRSGGHEFRAARRGPGRDPLQRFRHRLPDVAERGRHPLSTPVLHQSHHLDGSWLPHPGRRQSDGAPGNPGHRPRHGDVAAAPGRTARLGWRRPGRFRGGPARHRSASQRHRPRWGLRRHGGAQLWHRSPGRHRRAAC